MTREMTMAKVQKKIIQYFSEPKRPTQNKMLERLKLEEGIDIPKTTLRNHINKVEKWLDSINEYK